MDYYFDRLFWCPKSSVRDDVELMNKLTVVPDAYFGSPDPLRLFEIEDDYLGVPRHWGLRRFSPLKVIDRTEFPKVVWPELSVEWRKGQKEAVDTLTEFFQKDDLLHRGALLEAIPGSGKTLMGLAIARQLGTRALVLVHKNDLAEQWHHTGRMFFPRSIKGHCQQDSWKYLYTHFVTAMAQTLYARRYEIPDDFWKQFGMVIYDEQHRYPSRTFEYVLRMCPARYRLGVSATYKRSDGLEFVWNWHIGEIQHRVRTTSVVGKYAQIKWTTRIYDGWYKVGKKVNLAKIITAISKNVPYNVWLADLISRAAGANRKVLVVSDRIEQLLFLRQQLLKSAIDCTIGLYVGAVNKKKTSKEQLEAAKQASIILATYGMFSEGTDVPDLDTLFLATPRGEIEQVVGRIQRPHDDKKELVIVDPIFQTPFNRGLGIKRRKLYERIGFVEQGEE